MVAVKNSTGIKANSSFCTFRFPTAEARQLAKPFQYQPITTTLPTQPIAHFVFMPIYRCKSGLNGLNWCVFPSKLRVTKVSS
nr:MAG TPA_asm: hypothetical protein [Caudoviricetes sp.]